jgi:DNA-binding PadR family transcriptional regulator
VSVGMSLLAILDEGPTYGLQLKNEFEARTGGVWALNVGQVYTTLGRLQRDGLVSVEPGDQSEAQKIYTITPGGRKRLTRWFSEPTDRSAPNREELVLKLVMVARRRTDDAQPVIQAERRSAVQLLQEYTRLKREAPRPADLGWLFLLDSLIFQAEARVRWLDACEARLAATPPEAAPASPGATSAEEEVATESEVLR